MKHKETLNKKNTKLLKLELTFNCLQSCVAQATNGSFLAKLIVTGVYLTMELEKLIVL